MTLSRLSEVDGSLPEWEKARAILERAGELHGYEPEELTGGKRSDGLVWARHLAIAAVKRATSLSTTQIGRVFDRDHTSVLYALRKVEALAGSNPKIEAQLAELTDSKNV